MKYIIAWAAIFLLTVLILRTMFPSRERRVVVDNNPQQRVYIGRNSQVSQTTGTNHVFIAGTSVEERLRSLEARVRKLEGK